MVSAYESLDDFTVDVRVQIPASQYKALVEASNDLHTTVGGIVAELVRQACAGRPVPLPAPVDPPPREKRGLTPDRERIVRQMHAQGKSDSAIARVLGCSGSTAGDYRMALGLPRLYTGRRLKTARELAS